ncbi:MAG TPA: neutral zinc metallopeptidase [Syntrophobacteria bacterium]|nr:neutral zinc metallopeptidase [Syntrophobacteria bacterium]
MRWRDGRRSDNIEDRRGMPIPRRVLVGGSGGLGVVVLLLLGMFFGFDPTELLRGGPSVQSPSVSLPQSGGPAGRLSVEDELKEFVSVVVADTEDVWHDLFARSGRTYRPPKLVLFTRAVESQCGFAQAAMGPFYCPIDNKVYLDLSFFEELRSRFGAPGDFAEAYVIAHEVGHHVQTLLGVTQRFEEMRRRVGPTKANNLSVRLELQADCLAGVWANRAQKARQILEAGDIEEGLNAASAIGDDRLQRRTQGYVVPDAFTHGSSDQRVRWFKRGLEQGDISLCNTFKAERL